MKRSLKRLATFAVCFGVFVWTLNTNVFVTLPEGVSPRLLSHRGVHQIYAGSDRSNDACSANPIYRKQVWGIYSGYAAGVSQYSRWRACQLHRSDLGGRISLRNE